MGNLLMIDPSHVSRSFLLSRFFFNSSLGLSKTSRHSRSNHLIPVSASVSIWLVSPASKWEHIKVGYAGIEDVYNVHTDYEASQTLQIRLWRRPTITILTLHVLVWNMMAWKSNVQHTQLSENS